MKFESHAEKEFWEKAYLAALHGSLPDADAINSADIAIEARRKRMEKLCKKT